ncbi:MAG TPA: hypothetical protein PLC89_21605 [Haliscomenobacter sp.]|uniref:hypothetical protein n=1 Tax=Haliscomenobacter sp. TaxID=2717303 RepID=UPI002C9EBE87|nr:hypothetical protein [Haliscomenobacter sp.]HOY19924.1 hypothetical protein [Haliscomenobacter sp.]HPH21905.1 hypothetical protein [Haliscomenobacter sp.]
MVFLCAVATNITENSGLGKPKDNASKSNIKPLAAEKAAKIIIEGIEKNKFRVLVGSDARFLEFLYRFKPQYATDFIQKKMSGLLKF